MATPKQKIAPLKISEFKDKGKGLRAAGYSDSVSKKPKLVTESKGYIEAAKPFVDQLDAEIQAAMNHLPKVRGKAGYGEAVGSVEKMRKLKELLEGNNTENNKLEIVIKEQ